MTGSNLQRGKKIVTLAILARYGSFNQVCTGDDQCRVAKRVKRPVFSRINHAWP